MLLSSLIPNIEDLVSLSPEGLACPLLRVLESENPNNMHRGNFLSGSACTGYPAERQAAVDSAVTEAWHWLWVQGYLVPRANSRIDSDFVEISRAGRQFLAGCQEKEGAARDAQNRAREEFISQFEKDLEPPTSTPAEQVSEAATEASKETDNPLRSAYSGPDYINASHMSDQATNRDMLNFTPYVHAVAQFLNHSRTRPPLTLSIEGEWGSGKSSFMLQLRDRLRSISPTSVIVSLNPWMYEKQEQLWAAFALMLTRSLRDQAGFWRRLKGDAKLFIRRIKGFAGWWSIFTFLTMWALVIGLTFAVFYSAFKMTPEQQRLTISHLVERKPSSDSTETDTPGKSHNQQQDEKDKHNADPVYTWLLGLGTRGGAIAIALAVFSLLWKSMRDRLLDMRLERFIERPDYKGRSAFIDEFHDDFQKAVSCYLNPEGKAYVFVDDLDRCEIPKAADLISAMNLMIGDGDHLIFILAIDRQKVAAGIALKFETLVPLLPEYRNESGEPLSVEDKLAFGYSFLEKFVQLSVRVPVQNDPGTIRAFLEDLASHPPASGTSKETHKFRRAAEADSQRKFQSQFVGSNQHASGLTEVEVFKEEALDVEYRRVEDKAEESEGIRSIVLMVAGIFQFNPRRLKLFLNAYRLSVYIASRQGLFDLRRSSNQPVVTFEQLGKFVALTMRFPLLTELISVDRGYLANLEGFTLVSADELSKIAPQFDRPGVADLLRFGLSFYESDDDDSWRYSLKQLPLEKLLNVTPLAPTRQQIERIGDLRSALSPSFISLIFQLQTSLNGEGPERNHLLLSIAKRARDEGKIEFCTLRATSGDELDILVALGIAAYADLLSAAPEPLFSSWLQIALDQIKLGASPHADFVEYRALWLLQDMIRIRGLLGRQRDVRQVLERNMERLNKTLNRRVLAQRILDDLRRQG